MSNKGLLKGDVGKEKYKNLASDNMFGQKRQKFYES